MGLEEQSAEYRLNLAIQAEARELRLALEAAEERGRSAERLRNEEDRIAALEVAMKATPKNGNGTSLLLGKWALGILGTLITAAIIALAASVITLQGELGQIRTWQNATERDRFRTLDGVRMEQRLEAHIRTEMREHMTDGHGRE